MNRITIVCTSLMALMLAGCAARTSRPAHADAPQGPVIVRLVGQHQEVVVTSGPDGPLYSARASDGRMLVANATLEELRVHHPDVYQFVEPGVAVHADLDGAIPAPTGKRSLSDPASPGPLMLHSED